MSDATQVSGNLVAVLSTSTATPMPVTTYKDSELRQYPGWDIAVGIRNVRLRLDGSQPKDIPGAVMGLDYLAAHADKLLAQRDALQSQVAELTGELNARKVDADEVSKRCGELRAALNEAIDKLDRGFYAADISTRLRAALA